ncbi:MAG TPA: hypothetical protein VII52_02160 [Gemmatimonadaceae bacterium]
MPLRVHSGRTLFAVLAITLATPAIAQQPPRSLSFDCDSTFPATVTAAQLRSRYGASNVSRESIDIGEGEHQSATILFKDDSTRRVQILWRDTVKERSPATVEIHSTNTHWRTPTGLTTGMTLRAIERLNGRPFRLYGFGFDGSGVVRSWASGKLATPESAACRLGGALDDPVQQTSLRRWYTQATGDKEFSSAHKAMHALNPRLAQMQLGYR